MNVKNGIVDSIARDHIVETMVCKIAHQAMGADLEDLCQMVYLVLLEYDEDKLLDLWENGQIRFFIARVILNQFRSSTSPFHFTIRVREQDITGMDFIDE